MTNKNVVAAMASVVLALSGGGVAAQPVKIGVVAEFSGPFADYGTQIVNGMKTYLKLNGDTFGGIGLVDRNSPSAAPDIAAPRRKHHPRQRRHPGLRPHAERARDAAPIDMKRKADGDHERRRRSSTNHRMFVSHAAAGRSRCQVNVQEHRRAYTLVSDYGPGIDAEGAFVKAFAAGGEVINGVRTPLQNTVAPYLQRQRLEVLRSS
jgi:branched-chain amino acid transport system substrate-binding protein